MRNIRLIVFLNLMFFQVGLLESMMSALIPEMIQSFQISYGLASMIPLAYYLAFTLFCIPAGIAGYKYAPRKILFFAFLFALAGILVFVVSLRFQSAVLSLFMTGSAAAIIQVTAIPLVRKTCGAENLAFHTTINQLMFGLGAFLSPFLYSWLTIIMIDGACFFPINLLRKIIPVSFEWTTAYWLLILLIITLMVIVVLMRFPERVKEKKIYKQKRLPIKNYFETDMSFFIL